MVLGRKIRYFRYDIFRVFFVFLYRIESRSPKRVKIFDLFFQVGLGQKIVSRKKTWATRIENVQLYKK